MNITTFLFFLYNIGIAACVAHIHILNITSNNNNNSLLLFIIIIIIIIGC